MNHPMQLFHRELGGTAGPPILLLHGLLGSSRNWTTVARLLAERARPIGIDLRNHGESFHADGMGYPTLAGDVLDWMDAEGVDSAHFAGHSMGGKVAMVLACQQPERVRSLCIADIAPRVYKPHFKVAIEAMQGVDPSRFRRIAEVERELARVLDDAELRQFLVTNLRRNPEGTFAWQVHLPSLADSLKSLAGNPLSSDMRYQGPTLLLRGERSDFVRDVDIEALRAHFPRAGMTTVPGAGHNVHVENRRFFADQLLDHVYANG